MNETTLAAGGATSSVALESSDGVFSPSIPADAFLEIDECTARRIGVYPTPIVIGSADDCAAVFPADLGIAPRHAIFWLAGREVILRAPDPAAPVIVDGRPVRFVRLEDGDRVRLGELALTVRVRATTKDSASKGDRASGPARSTEQSVAADPDAAQKHIALRVDRFRDQGELLRFASRLERSPRVNSIALTRTEPAGGWFVVSTPSMEALLSSLQHVEGFSLECATVTASVAEARVVVGDEGDRRRPSGLRAL